jgi:WD40 repeat protein
MKLLILALFAFVTGPAIAGGPTRVWNKPLLLETNRIIQALAFSPDNQYLAVGMEMGHLEIFPHNCPDGLPLGRSTRASCGRFDCLAFSGDSKRLLVGGCPGGMNLFEIPSEKQLQEFSLLLSGPAGLSADGKQMWANGKVFDLTGEIKELQEPRTVREFPKADVLQVTDSQIITIRDGRIGFWNPADGKLQREFDTGNPKTWFHSLSPAGYLVVSDDRGVHVWDLACGQRMASVPVKETCHDALITPDGKRLVTVTGKYTVRVWEVATGKVIATLATTAYYWPVAVSPGGTVAYTKDGHRVEFWNADAVR